MEQMRYANVTPIYVLVAMNRHQQLPIESAEEHTMAEIRRSDWLFLLYPWAVESSAFRVGDSLCICIKHPTCPNHAQTACLSSKQIRPVGHSVWAHFTIQFLTTPRRCARSEQEFSFANRSAEVGFQLYFLYRPIPVLQPFMAINHIGLSIGVHPKRSIQRQLVRWQKSTVTHRAVRTFSFVGNEHMACTAFEIVAPIRPKRNGLVGKRGEVIVTPFVLMKLGCPYLRPRPHPRCRVCFGHEVWPIPKFQVFAFPKFAARSSHVVSHGRRIGQYARVAQYY